MTLPPSKLRDMTHHAGTDERDSWHDDREAADTGEEKGVRNRIRRPKGYRLMAEVAKRRSDLIAAIAGAEHGCTRDELCALLPHRPAKRTVQKDLAWLRKVFHSQVRRANTKGAHRTGRTAYVWKGQVPHLLTRPLEELTHDELLALIVARGLLATGPTSEPGSAAPVAATAPAPPLPVNGTGAAAPDDRTRDTPSPDGPLASAVDGLLHRAGLIGSGQEMQNLSQARDAVCVRRFGTAPVAPEVLQQCLKAVVTGQHLRFHYVNRYGQARETHASPQRLVLTKGEWFAVMWVRRGLATYRLSRMGQTNLTPEAPKGCPTHIPSIDVNYYLSSGFYGTFDQDPISIVLAISPDSWPHVVDRTWGRSQQVEGITKGRRKGWYRLTFTTRGYDECKHWVLSMGSGVKVEQPAELREWIKGEARSMLRG